MGLRLQSGGQIPIKLTGNIYETLIFDKIKTCLLSLKIYLQQLIAHTVVTKERFLKVHTETAHILKLGKALPSLRPLTTIRALFWMRKTLVVTADFDQIL